MAASVAASVVWLTAITLLSDFGSTLASGFTALVTVFDSIFLLVTDTFNFSGVGFAATLDEVFAFGGFALTAVFGATFATVFVAALIGGFALPVAAFFTTGFAIDLPEAGLVAADFAFFAVTAGFAGFFIAFAMESIPTGLLSCAERIALGGADVSKVARHSPALHS